MIKLLTGPSRPLVRLLSIYDGLDNEVSMLDVKRRLDCPCAAGGERHLCDDVN